MFRILIVEDDLETQRLFAHVLSKNGYRVDCARNGKEALSALDREYYDLLISDIMMPVMDGYELVQSLREANMTPPVLMITAKDGFDDMRQGFLAGADDYMVKPVNVNEILLRVQALLRRAREAAAGRLYVGRLSTAIHSPSARRAGTAFCRRKSLCCCSKWPRSRAGSSHASS